MKSFIRILFILFAAIAVIARDDTPTVIYKPSLKLIEGDQPLHTSYVLEITSPPNVAPGSSLSISPVLAVVSSPDGVSTATALSFISFSPSTLVFSGPNQSRTTTVTVDVPLGTAAGDYSWAISTPGWPGATLDPFAFINAKVTIPQAPVAPSVSLGAPLDGAIYSYLLGGPPVSIALAFTASAPAASPISSIDADVAGIAVSLTSSGIGTDAVTASGTIQLSQAGLFTVRARATNNAGTSSDTVEVTVNLEVPPPTVAITQPLTDTDLFYSGTPLSVPFSFTATSLRDGITSLGATLNGVPVVVTPSGLATLNATGSGSLSIGTSGSHVLAVTATSPHGTSSASRVINVSAPAAPPTITIASPAEGTVITRVAGSSPTSLPLDFTAVAASGSTISALNGSLNSTSVPVTITGLGTAIARGTGSLLVSAPGTYTFVASATGGGTNAARSVSFTVNEIPVQSECTIEWLPPISLGKVQQGGSILPIKFMLACRNRSGGSEADEACDHKRDVSVVVAISEVFANGSFSEPELFAHDPHGPASGGYALNLNGMYHLNYPTGRGVHAYHIDVYRATSTPALLGTKQFTTR